MSHTVTLTPSGRRFEVEPDETVLAAAQRAGLALPYSCLGGTCGSCKGTILEGSCHYPYNPPQALDEDERAHQAALLCQAVPLGPLSVAVREVDVVRGYPRRILPVRVAARRLLAPDVLELELEPPPGELLDYLPGQYLDVLLRDGRKRAFSIANAPAADHRLHLHIRRVPGGGFTEWAFDSLREGERLRIEGPLGTFVLREDSERPMLFVAGGTGFAPIKAMIEHLTGNACRRSMTLYWGVRTPADLYAAELIARWCARDELRFVPVYSEAAGDTGARSGHVHQAVITDHPDLSAHDVYMSGPPPMIDAARHAFVAAELPADRLFYDSFDYAPDVLATLARARAGFAREA